MGDLFARTAAQPSAGPGATGHMSLKKKKKSKETHENSRPLAPAWLLFARAIASETSVRPAGRRNDEVKIAERVCSRAFMERRNGRTGTTYSCTEIIGCCKEAHVK